MASFFGTVFDYLVGNTDNIDASQVVKNVKKNNYSSIAAKASEGILQFPVITSNAIDFETAVLVAKACERSYAGFAKVVFSMNRDMSDTNTSNVSDYLSTFHQNTTSTTDSDPATLGNAFESFAFEDKEKNVTYECKMIFPKESYLNSQLKEDLRPYIENFCLTKLNDLYNPKRISNTGYTINMEGWIDNKKPSRPSVVKEAIVRGINVGTVANGEREKVFLDSEVKKANEMQPTFIKLQVSRIQVTNGNPVTVNYDITIGIKATLHVVTSQEYISNLVDACEYKGTLFRFIKWSSGEIDFIRDFVLRMDLFAKETKNRVEKNSNWWEALKNRAREAKISRVNSNRLLPNATFVFTKAEAEYIKANFGYDLLSKKMATRLMKEYFLLGYIVVDTASEIAYILYDGQKEFQTYTFRALEREGSNPERQFKEFLKATKKM